MLQQPYPASCPASWLKAAVRLALAAGLLWAAVPVVEAQRAGRPAARPVQKAAPKSSPKGNPQPPSAPLTSPGKPLPAGALQAFVEQLAARPALQGARLGIHIEDAETGEVLADVAGEKRFLPASNMKLVTTAAALGVLGPDFRVRTSVYMPPPDANGVVTGDLTLVGRGDPTISDRYNTDKKTPA